MQEISASFISTSEQKKTFSTQKITPQLRQKDTMIISSKFLLEDETNFEKPDNDIVDEVI